ncbi:MAG: dipeptidase [Gemmatimonadota bacterium]|nr:dipeptidase [Gemmatimonadota bacterium]
MRRRRFLRLAGGAALASGLGCGRGAEDAASRTAGERATGAAGPVLSAPEELHLTWPGYDEAIVVDALAGPIQFNIPQQTLPLDPVALDRVRASGITAVNLTVNGRPSEGETAFDATVDRMAAWAQEAEAHGDTLFLARSVSDLRRAKQEGWLALIFGFQDGVPFEDDLDRLEGFYSMGLRIVQPTYNVQNRLGSGCLAPRDDGLTALGREAVARMEAMGILLDLSHCGPRTTRDAIQVASGPVSITHSGCSAVFEHPRSKDDETLRLLADRGGVVGIYLMPFLNAEGPPAAEDVIVHVEHALDVCGEDHVGIGSDQGIVPLDTRGDFRARFDEVSAQRHATGIAAPREDTVPFVPELNHPRRMETIAGLLSARGHSDAVVEKVIGGNFMRLFEEVW